MCVVSMICDHYIEKWSPWETLDFKSHEIDRLKEEVIELRELLYRAKKYDEENHQDGCEIDSKVEFLKKIAKLVNKELD